MRRVCKNWRDALTIPPPFLLPSAQVPYLLLPRTPNEPPGSIFRVTYHDMDFHSRLVPSALPLLAAHNEDEGYFFYVGSSFGWIFLAYPNSRITLFNLLSRDRYDLPPLNEILAIELVGNRFHIRRESFKISTPERMVNLAVASSNPSRCDDFIIVLVLRDDDLNVYTCRPKFQPHFWNVHPHDSFHAVDVMYFEEKFYFISDTRKVCTLSLSQEDKAEAVFSDYEVLDLPTLDELPGTPFLVEHASCLMIIIVDRREGLERMRVYSLWENEAWWDY